MRRTTGILAVLVLLAASLFGTGCGTDQAVFTDVGFEFSRISEDGNKIGTVTASWDADSVPMKVYRFDFYRADSEDGEGTLIRSEESPRSQDRMEFTGFDQDATHYYYIAAIGSSGEIERTEVFSVVVLADEYSRSPLLTASNTTQGIRLRWRLRQHHEDISYMILHRKSGEEEYQEIHRYNPFYSYSRDDIEGDFTDDLTPSDDGTTFTYMITAQYDDGDVDSNEASILFVYTEQATFDLVAPVINDVVAEEESGGINFIVDYDNDNEPAAALTLRITFVPQAGGDTWVFEVYSVDPDTHEEFFTSADLSEMGQQGVYDAEVSMDAVFNDDRETSNVVTVSGIDISW